LETVSETLAPAELMPVSVKERVVLVTDSAALMDIIVVLVSETVAPAEETLVSVEEWEDLVMDLVVAVEGITARVDNMIITILTQLHKHEKNMFSNNEMLSSITDYSIINPN
jgi:hypothetical protein